MKQDLTTTVGDFQTNMPDTRPPAGGSAIIFATLDREEYGRAFVDLKMVRRTMTRVRRHG